MSKIKPNQYGFALLVPILAIVLILGIGGTQVYRIQQAKKTDSQLSASQKEAEDKLRLANELKQTNEAKQEENNNKKEEKPEDKPAATNPKSAPDQAPKPAPPAIVHPTSADCSKGEFTVYASVKTGTKAYSSTSASNAFATYSFGTALKLQCYTYASGKPYPGWLLYNDGFIKYSDVSKTKP